MSNEVVSDIEPCESQQSFCTYTPFDNLHSSSAQTSDITQCVEPNNICTKQSFDNPDNVSANTIDSSLMGTEGTLRKFISNPQTHVKPKTSLTRNPPKLEQSTWDKYDSEYSAINQKSWDCLRKGLITPEQFVTDLNGTLASFLESKDEFVKVHKEFLKHTPQGLDPLEEARKLKIELNKKSKTS